MDVMKIPSDGSHVISGRFQSPYNQNPYNHNPYCVGILIGSVGILIGFVGILIGLVGILIGSAGLTLSCRDYD